MGAREKADAAQIAAQFLIIAMVVGANCLTIWLSLPPQQRMWIRLAVAGRVRRIAATAAWREGRAGMSEELVTGQRSVRYGSAYGLSLLRDRAHRLIEDMRP